MNDNAQTIEDFYGVYLLYCTNPKYTGRTYIGYTVDPNRRIKQHNKGKDYGGAWRTSKKGPWVMVMIIHGFPNDVAALRFEWAWQHPQVSRRLRHVPKKKAREKTYDFCLRVLAEMLQVGPWNRLPLTIRWLSPDHTRDFPTDKNPPMHMPICHGPVISKKLSKTQQTNDSSDATDSRETEECFLCLGAVECKKQMKCLSANCDMTSHVICLSKKFLPAGEYVPIEGKCPKCSESLLWGDLVRKLKGCNHDVDINLGRDVGCEFLSSDSE